MSIASELQDKIDAKAAIKASIEAKGVTVGNVKLNQYASKVDAIAQDPSVPVGSGQHLVTFYDFDGKVLKRQRVNTGENATAPAIPTHQYLTFAEWNNPFTNVQSDIDTGTIYNTTDGKTYLFITLTPVTGLAPTLFFSKSSTSLMTIDWGDGTTSTSTTSGNQSINHVYATAGDYIITVDNSAGGTWQIGQGSSATSIFSNGMYSKALTKIYFGKNVSSLVVGSIGYEYKSLRFISTGNFFTAFGNAGLISSLYEFLVLPKNCTSLEGNAQNNSSLINVVHGYGNTNVFGSMGGCLSINKIIIPSTVTSVGTFAFTNCLSITQYIFLSAIPPTLTNITAFSGINPICKIYVPDASVAAYKAATNWKNFSAYIYPLSQKPQSDE